VERALLTISFEPLRESDLPTLAAWLARPHVERWWREPSDLATVEERYRPLFDGSDSTEGFIVVLNSRLIGFIQSYLIDDHPDWRASIESVLGESAGIGIDYLIGEADLVGQGIGRRMISEFVVDCWRRYPLVARIVVVLQQANVGSWKALEASGFRRVWEGEFESTDPSDRGPSFVYVLGRPGARTGS
jgi:aminoglycoside 6'-N-acetyltransferase